MFDGLINIRTRKLIPNTHVFDDGEAAWALHKNRWYRVRIAGARPPIRGSTATRYIVWHWKLSAKNTNFGALAPEDGRLAPDDELTRSWLRTNVGRRGIGKTDWPAVKKVR